MMTTRSVRAVAVAVAAGLVAAGCGGSAPTVVPTLPPVTPGPTVAAATATPAPMATPGPALGPTGALTEDISRAVFGDGTTIDNRWLPMLPGSQWTWEGVATTDDGPAERRVVLVITDLVKLVDGVETVVAWERDWTDGQLNEAELVFFAQDDEGFVWHLGQYPEEYEDGRFVDAPAWIAGQRDARAGIFMLAEPVRDQPSYSQGWGPEVGWTDRARVFEVGSRTCVPVSCFDDVVVIDEFSYDEPDSRQVKYYAPGVGNVRVGWAGALEPEREVLELVEHRQLTPDELAEARAAALELERHAYEVSPDVYGTTQPARPRS